MLFDRMDNELCANFCSMWISSGIPDLYVFVIPSHVNTTHWGRTGLDRA